MSEAEDTPYEEVKEEVNENSGKLASIQSLPLVRQQEMETFLGGYNNLAAAVTYTEYLSQKGLVSKDKIKEYAKKILFAKNLGFPEAIADQVHVIEGRPTLPVHLMTALLKTSGHEYKLIKDGEYLYEDGTYTDYPIPNKKYIDRVTEIVFYTYNEKMKMTIENTIKYTLTEAAAQGLLEKANWKKLQKDMLRARCLSKGARFVAPDKLSNVYSTEEMADVHNLTLELDEEGKVVNLKK
jgi:hypothetical protein